MPEKRQNLIDFVHPQGGFALLKVADEAEANSGPLGQVILG